MKRLLAVLVALTIVAAACGGSDEVVASVNGMDIPRSDVEKLATAADEDGAASEFTRLLTVVIQWRAISQAAVSDFGINPTKDEISIRLDELVAGQAEGATLEEYLAAVDASEEGIREFARQLLIQDGVQAQLAETAEPIGDDAINAELANSPLDWTVVCASHILVETEEEAVAAAARLDAGEDFATVAQDVSLDPGSGPNGGDLGCSSPAGYVPSFATATMAAELAVPTAPVESEFGFHLILVTQREEATPELVRDALERDALVGAVDSWFMGVIESADVTVDEEIGVWVTEPSPQVLSVN
jgi:parvulin-like peptidyl-prolyl isomerase